MIKGWKAVEESNLNTRLSCFFYETAFAALDRGAARRVLGGALRNRTSHLTTPLV